MPVPPVVPAELRSRVFRGTAVVGAGLLTRAQLRSSPWRRVLPDVYVHEDVAVTHALRARAAAGVLLPDAVVTGCSAAVLWGVDLAGPADDVELTRAPGTNPVRVPGLRVRRAVLPPGAVGRRRGVAVTTPEATAAAVAAALPGDDGVVAVDRLVHSGVVDLDAVRRCAASLTGPGSRRARDVCALADGLAESPQETRVRLLVRRSPLPDPVAQFRVYDGARFVARVDFGWPDRRVALEYDGLWHADPGQLGRDRARLNRLTAAGWRVVFGTAADLHHGHRLLARVAVALGG
ncbi:endonuclease domain-containing protein [Modestobacter lapidis]|nr:hypothetical protein [Modestobacter lapidis]